MAPEVVAARHNRVLVGGLGIITSSITKEQGIKEAPIDAALLRQVGELIAQVINV
jgi:hypothetical protein